MQDGTIDMEDKRQGRYLGFKEWLQRTFTDHNGIPSFKRQFALLVFLTLIGCILLNKDPDVIETLAWLSAGILGITGAEKFSKTPRQ